MPSPLVVNSGLPPNAGEVYYLVKYYGGGEGHHTYRLHADPQRTNISQEIRATGFLGCNDNRCREALGKIRVTRTARFGEPRNNAYVINYRVEK